MHGFLSIDKPAGWTSHDVVGYIRKQFRTTRVGHAGTLDPDATGVLLVAVGNATRLLPYVQTEPKVYDAIAAFGVATSTEDASGTETERVDATSLSENDLAAVIPTFVGAIQQVPPMVSAVHHHGQRLYELARKGIVVERNARTVQIMSIAQGDFTPGPLATMQLTIACGTGTYIRTLCVDIGRAVNLPAHMQKLLRVQVGPHMLTGSVPPHEATVEHLRPMADLLPQWPRFICDDEACVQLSFGRGLSTQYLNPVLCSPVVDNDSACYALALSPAGDILALMKSTEGQTWQPIRVFLPVEGKQ